MLDQITDNINNGMEELTTFAESLSRILDTLKTPAHILGLLLICMVLSHIVRRK